MKMKFEKIKMVLLAVLTLGTLTACEDTMLNNMVEDRVYLLKVDLQLINVYNANEPIIPIDVVKSGIKGRTAQLKLDIKPELLAAYNTAQQKDYKLLNPTIYRVLSSTLDMGADDYQQAFKLLLDSEKFKAEQAMFPTATFAIPCEVTLLNPAPNEKATMQTIIIPTLIEPYIQFTKAGFLSDINNISSSSLSILHYYSKVEVNYPNLQDVNFKVELAKDYQVLIQQYNDAHKDENDYEDYIVLPSTSYELHSDWTIAKGANYTGLDFKVFKDKLVDNTGKPQYGKYMLPLRIIQVSINKIHPDNDLVFIPFDYHE